LFKLNPSLISMCGFKGNYQTTDAFKKQVTGVVSALDMAVSGLDFPEKKIGFKMLGDAHIIKQDL